MNSASNSDDHQGLVTALPAVWTAVPLSGSSLHRNEALNDSISPFQVTRRRSVHQLLHGIFLKMNVPKAALFSMIIFLVLSTTVLTGTCWWLRAFLGVFIAGLQLYTLPKLDERSFSPYYMTQKMQYVLASVACILLGIVTGYARSPWFAPVYYDVNALLFIVLGMLSRAKTPLHEGVPNALFSCPSSNKGWVCAILWAHPFLVLNTFFLASLSNEGQSALNKPFFWLAGWPALFMSHLWRRQVALRLYVRSDAAVVVDTTTQRLVFDQVKLAYEAPLDNDLRPEYFENVFDADSSRCVVVERRNGMKHFVVCPEEPEDFIQAVSLAAKMCARLDDDEEQLYEPAYAVPTTDEYAATVRSRRP